jgi:hypothetical protein
MTQTIEKQARNYVENPPTASEITTLFWDKVYNQIDVDEIVYDIISDFDHHFLDKDGNDFYGWYIEDDTDEKDSLRDEVLDAIGYSDAFA